MMLGRSRWTARHSYWTHLLFYLLLYTWIEVHCIWTRFALVRPYPAWGSTGTTPYIKINTLHGSGPNVTAGANFGCSVAMIGDLDSNGWEDIAVGASGESWQREDGEVFDRTGSVYILFMAQNATIASQVRIGSQENGGPPLGPLDQFGSSVAAIGDLNGDGVPDLMVGAPGSEFLSGAYILFLNSDGSVAQHKLIRGEFLNNTIGGYDINGPPISYGSRLGFAVAALGDVDLDGITDLAISSINSGSGLGRVFIMFMQADGTVTSYREIAPNKNGGPDISSTNTGFGSALLQMPDFDGDKIPELLIGANLMSVAGSYNPKAGEQYFCYLDKSGRVKSHHVIGEFSLQDSDSGLLPNLPLDHCGSSLAYIGDINRDDQNQLQYRIPPLMQDPPRPQIPDFVTGCPQTLAGDQSTGRMFLMFLTNMGSLAGFRVIPDQERDIDRHVAPSLSRNDRFGWALTGYVDVDRNGIRELIAGAPGDSEVGTDAGAIYIIFLRRMRYHPPAFNFVIYVLTITLPTFFCFVSCVSGVYFFFWYFRRQPDEIEIIVKKSGYELSGKRQKYVKTGQVATIEYTL